jgi:hypothetical protein
MGAIFKALNKNKKLLHEYYGQNVQSTADEIPKLTFPREMLVWNDDDINWNENNIYVKTVIAYADGKKYPWIIGDGDINIGYRYAKEIETKLTFPCDMSVRI